ncbi:uncharacterized protein SCHCODRAFT_02491365 [Schizophyllum commune H4-8]|uniref:Expressed protein n=1 Tax=Schizophyllum commune (strain H4-8 / FGSC 9210) TaxID=578458 RepID=D8PZH5_SCHCM|nr:uncharacterized protein SCHCODRAFT_02491365 [Schizophyllum commune H4-8]KAI5896376.1 hypothetical protein SCHCODRAFT_02491365 [Schizophyllum commune H4-8]
MGWAVGVPAASRAAAAGASAVVATMRSPRRRTTARRRGRGVGGRMGVNAARQGLPSSALSAPAFVYSPIPSPSALYCRARSRRRAHCRAVLISHHLVPRQLHLCIYTSDRPSSTLPYSQRLCRLKRLRYWTPRPACDGPLHIEPMHAQQM